ncbi:hypothetical protein J4558_07650 [Leptolyngbya sp. 15MV]|nr:hypothetical protein J4558_07650 [Leptolyngbya sp. 15MV]
MRLRERLRPLGLSLERLQRALPVAVGLGELLTRQPQLTLKVADHIRQAARGRDLVHPAQELRRGVGRGPAHAGRDRPQALGEIPHQAAVLAPRDLLEPLHLVAVALVGPDELGLLGLRGPQGAVGGLVLADVHHQQHEERQADHAQQGDGDEHAAAPAAARRHRRNS